MHNNSEKRFGEIEFVKNTRAKRINIRIFKDKLKISLPAGTTENEALRFLEKVSSQILNKQEKLRKQEKNNPLILHKESELETCCFKIRLVESSTREHLFFSLKNELLSIEYPHFIDFNDENTQRVLWTGINHFLKKEAKKRLPSRVSFLANKYGFSYETVKIQSSKTRWGSCSQAKNINLSFYLMLLPQHLIDYIVLHELCHTKEMNHGENFWRWMDRVTENKSKLLRSELKKYNIPQF